MKNTILAAVLLCPLLSWAQSSPYTNHVFAPVTMTASGQTSAAIGLSAGATGDSYASATITLTGTALTTATFAVYGSNDSGVNFFPLNLSAIATPGTTATTMTATASGMYQVNLAGINVVKFVTSGTFTATNIKLVMTATPNGLVSRNSGASGGAVTSVNGQVGPVVLGFADVGAAAASEPIGAAAQTTANAAIPLAQKAAPNGVASLGAGGLVPAGQLGTGASPGTALFGDGTFKIPPNLQNPVQTNLVREYQYQNSETGSQAVDYSTSNIPCVFGPTTQAPTRGTFGLNFVQTAHQYCDTQLPMTQAQTVCSFIQFPTYGLSGSVLETLYGSSTSTSTSILMLNQIGNAQFNQTTGIVSIVALPSNVQNLTTNSAMPGYGTLCWVRNATQDVIYINGVAQTIAAIGSLGSNTDNLWIGASFSLGTCNANACAFTGTVAWTDVYSSQLTAADAAKVSAYQALQVQNLKGFAQPLQIASANQTLVCKGDSITGGFNGTAPCTTLSLDNTTTVASLGNPGEALSQMLGRIGVVKGMYPANAAYPLLMIWGGTNDLSSSTPTAVAALYANYCSQAKLVGFRAFTATILDRVSSGAFSPTTRNATNALIRAGSKSWGCVGNIDMASDPFLGADGANNLNATGCSGGPFFNLDRVHPTTCADTNDIAPMISRVINNYTGASEAGPTLLTGTTAVLVAHDGFVNWTPSGTATGTLPECMGMTGTTFTVNNLSATNAITMSAAGAEIISGSGAIATNTTGKFTVMLTAASTGGCFWLRQ